MSTLSPDEIEAQLRVEFVDDARDRTVVMNKTIEKVAKGQMLEAAGIASLRMEAHGFKGMGSSFGYPGISLIAHRLEDYLAGLNYLRERELADIQIFIDHIAALVDRAEQPKLAETNQIIRQLPVRYVFDVADVEVHDVEIMLVTPSKVVSKLVGTELAACGFRCINVQDPIEALGLAIRMPPDMLIASLVMDGLSGLDLMRGLHAMSITQKMAMGLLTSLELNNPALKEIPPEIAVIRVGTHFGDDFAAAITRFNLG